MFANKLVVAIKANGKVLREFGDVVKLPYGSEFSILVKNLNNKRVKFILYIDGTDVLDGTEIIVNENSEIELKRFIRNSNMNEGNAFKFIERTISIEDGPRGIKIEDGIVRVEYWFEETPQVVYKPQIVWVAEYQKYMPVSNPYGNNGPYWNKGISGAPGSLATDIYPNNITNNIITRGIDSATYGSVTGAVTQSATAVNNIQTNSATVLNNDAGITVPGSKVEQKFQTVYGFKSEVQSYVIILKLVGVVGETVVTKPITVAHKPTCTTCGKINKASSAFCSQCGTALKLF